MNAHRGSQQAFALGVFAEADEHLADELLEACAGERGVMIARETCGTLVGRGLGFGGQRAIGTGGVQHRIFHGILEFGLLAIVLQRLLSSLPDHPSAGSPGAPQYSKLFIDVSSSLTRSR